MHIVCQLNEPVSLVQDDIEVVDSNANPLFFVCVVNMLVIFLLF